MEKLEVDTKKNIISILTSCPLVVSMKDLHRDYKNMIGSDIPYCKLGYSCLEEFLRAITDTVIVYGSGPMAEVKPVITEKSAHVNKLVTQQKLPQKRQRHFVQKRNRDFSFPRTNFPTRSLPPVHVRKIHYPPVNISSMPIPRPKPFESGPSNLPTPPAKISSTNSLKSTTPQNSNIQPTSNSKLQSENSSSLKRSNEGFVSKENISPSNECVGNLGRGKLDLRHTLSDRQPVNKPFTMPKLEITEKKFANMNINFENIRLENIADQEQNVPLHIRNRLKQLIGRCPNGIWVGEVLEKYRMMFNTDLNFREMGFVNLKDMFIYLPSIFHYVRPSTGDFKLYDSSKPLPDCAEKTFTVASYGTCTNKSRTEFALDNALPNVDWQDINRFLPECVFKHGEEIPRAFLPHDIRVGDDIGVQVSEIFDISKFWVYLADSSLDKLMDDMQVFYKDHCEKYLLPQHLIKEGLYCVQVIFGEYHRALIVDGMLEVPETVKVVFIDYGTMTKVSTKGMCFLHDDFARLPAQAIRCRLANLCPVEEGVTWSRESRKEFRKLVDSRTLSAKISSINWDEQFFEVYLADVTNEDRIFFINDKLVKDSFAQYVTKERKKPILHPIYTPIVKHIHLFPTFLELEYGLAPSSYEMDVLNDCNVPINFCYPQYFYMEFTGEEKIIRAAESFHDSHCLRRRHKAPIRYFDLDKRKKPSLDFSIFGGLEAEIREFINTPRDPISVDSSEEDFEDADEDFMLNPENSSSCNMVDTFADKFERMPVENQQEATNTLKKDILTAEGIMNDINYICSFSKENSYPETTFNLLESQTDNKGAKGINENEHWTRSTRFNETRETEKSLTLLDYQVMKAGSDDISGDEFFFDHPLSKMTFDKYSYTEDENSSPNTPESECSAKLNNIFDLVQPNVHLRVGSFSDTTSDNFDLDFSHKELIEIPDFKSEASTISSTNPFLNGMTFNGDVSKKEIPTLNPNNPFLSYIRKNNVDMNKSVSSDDSTSTVYKGIVEEQMQPSWNNFDDLTAETIRQLGKVLCSSSNSSSSQKLSDNYQNPSTSTQTSDESDKPSALLYNNQGDNHQAYVCLQPPPMYPKCYNNPYYHVRPNFYPGYPYESQLPQMPVCRPHRPPGFGPPPGFAPLGAQRIDHFPTFQNQVQRFPSYPNYYASNNYPLTAPALFNTFHGAPNAMVPCAPNAYNRTFREAVSTVQINEMSPTTSMSSLPVSVVSGGKDFYDLYNEQLKVQICADPK